MRLLLCALVFLGGTVGALDVAAIAVAGRQDAVWLAGALPAVFSAAGLLGGILFARLQPATAFPNSGICCWWPPCSRPDGSPCWPRSRPGPCLPRRCCRVPCSSLCLIVTLSLCLTPAGGDIGTGRLRPEPTLCRRALAGRSAAQFGALEGWRLVGHIERAGVGAGRHDRVDSVQHVVGEGDIDAREQVV